MLGLQQLAFRKTRHEGLIYQAEVAGIRAARDFWRENEISQTRRLASLPTDWNLDSLHRVFLALHVSHALCRGSEPCVTADMISSLGGCGCSVKKRAGKGMKLELEEKPRSHSPPRAPI